MNVQERPAVAIVGAGLSGLVCARILQRAGLPVTIHEADTAADARRQGGSLDIHTATGQEALRQAGVFDQFRALVRHGGEATRVMDRHARLLVDESEVDGGNGRPEVERQALRQLLVDALEPGTIRWGAKVTGVRTDGPVRELQFVDGSTVTADLVVGADGAWSRVRSTALTSTVPEYTGITMVELRLSDAVRAHPEALRTTGHGTFFALSDNKSIGGHGGEEIALGLGLRVPEDWAATSGIDWTDPMAARAALLREYRDWAGPLTDMIRDSDDTIWPRPIYALPIGLTWRRVPGVTAVGDAAHLMSPFAGEGANLALIDGADLARTVIESPHLDRALGRYERKMFRRAKASASASARGLAMIFNDDAPRQMVSFFERAALLARLTRPLTRLLPGRP
ncbi:NAD(P)/FAD-dependent oxidoreductase [Curtobacterium sp. MCBD17_035]|uniref:FAD-dependent oxidoreductase n=1 Tax=Curtobacterium sp. MCBD17_035 TaxID=2175673 RepID=UPI000DA7733D|nr:NAD(P)/FAD-dependent oxidoreductase [Curtobacterium sp. MCBD17_035]WIB68146.1 NAD(P)/FAD-dependent oxidoreductase [Curtobacterium sp. MCBD17_035]